MAVHRGSMMPLYRRVLGARYGELPAQVQALHDLTGTAVWRGMADVERGGNIFCRLAGWITSLPAAGPAQSLTVTFEVRDGVETWTRRFGASIFRSTQFACGDHLCERVGPATFHFDTPVDGGVLRLRLRSLRVLGIPVPKILQPSVATEEREIDGRYHFFVESRLPLFGLLVRYAGSLTRVEDERSA